MLELIVLLPFKWSVVSDCMFTVVLANRRHGCSCLFALDSVILSGKDRREIREMVGGLIGYGLISGW